MKKKRLISLHWGKMRKLVLICFLTTGMFLSLLPGMAVTYAQNKVTIEMKEKSLKNVLHEIQAQTHFRFLYSTEDVQSVIIKEIKVSNAGIEEVLDNILKGTGLTYRIHENIIYLKHTPPQPAVPQIQSLSITGKVTDSQNDPLPGVTVRLKGSKIGTATDADGKFHLEIPQTENTVLVFSFIGMLTKEYPYKGEKTITIRLEEEVQKMEDVVVTGIFRRTKELATGASITVTGEELKQVGNQNILQSLRTLDPSFKIVENNQSGSDPNVLPDIEIRGANGIPDLDANYKGNPNQPLFILDGFETTLQNVIDLDPNRVASISILKDASAAALYGSRSANGVVVIETKAPETGRLRLSYTGDYAIVIPDLRDYDVLNAGEKLQLQKEAGHFDGKTFSTDLGLKEYYNRILERVLAGTDTYWLSQPVRTAFEHRHNFRLTGGDDVLRYGINFSARIAPGVMKQSGRNNYQGGVLLSYRKKQLIFQNDLQVSYNLAKNSPYGKFSQYVSMNPYERPKDENGKPTRLFDEQLPSGFNSAYNSNPLYDAKLNIVDQNDYVGFTNNFSMEWHISDNFILMGRFNLSFQNAKTEKFLPAEHTKFANMGDPVNSPEEYLRRGEFTYNTNRSVNLGGDVNLRFGQSFGKHNLFCVAGFNVQQGKSKGEGMKVEGFANQNMSDIGFAKQYYKDTRPESTYQITRLAGILGTFNYSYDFRYLFDFSIKMDGSSNFGKNNQYAPVWSLGVGWNIHREHWWKDQELVSLLKLRASYGVTASQNFSSFQAMSMYQYDIKRQYAGIVPPALKAYGNENLKWQQTKITNLGFELGLDHDRFMLTLDWYTRKTNNLLADVTIAPSTGFSSFKDNIGETENKGVDLTLRYMIIRDRTHRINWSVNASLSHNENKITRISNAMEKRNQEIIDKAVKEYRTAPVLLYQEGQSLTSIYAVPSQGIDPATGKEVFTTRTGLQTFTWNSADQIAVGDTHPKLEGVIGTSFTYKDLTLSANFRYKTGGQIYNNTLVTRVENADLYGNVDRRVYDKRWMNPGDKVMYKDARNTEPTRPTSRFVEDENTLSCESVSLGYDLRSKKILQLFHMERLRFNGYMNDIFRLSTVHQERGIDYPFANRFAFSISATF